ncbi:MAG TPA: hypothetical protein VF498_08470 [Anaerolineales bacterium]
MDTFIKVRDQEGFPVKGDDGRRIELILRLPGDKITVRELIRARVQQEIAEYNQRKGEYYWGLVHPAEAERTLNGYKMPRYRPVNEQEQVKKALQAFQSNGFILLVDNRQVESLDQAIEVGPDTTATFLKLVALVGG